MGTYLRTFVLSAAMAAVCLMLANVILDPYRIFRVPIGKLSFQPNSRVYKLEFMSRHCMDYDVYFVGDSRAHILTGRDLENVGGHRFYNLAAPRDEITSIVPRLKLLVAAGCPVATVIAGESIDIVSTGKNASLLDTESPLISGQSRLSFLGKFLFSSQPLIDYLGQNAFGSQIHFMYGSDGHVEYLWRMKSPADLGAAPCRPPQLSEVERRLLFAKLRAYRELADLSIRNHFQAIVWITPFNAWKQQVFDDPDVRRFFAQLRSIPHLSVIDADRNSPLLSDFTEWTDCLHFRPPVFDELVAPSILRLLSRQSP
jgi:hypothetical protein